MGEIKRVLRCWFWHTCVRANARTLSVVHLCMGYVGVSICGQHCGNRIRPRHTIHTKTLLVKTTNNRCCSANFLFARKNYGISYNILFTRQKPIWLVIVGVFEKFNSYKFNYANAAACVVCVMNWNSTNDTIMVNSSPPKKINKIFSAIMPVPENPALAFGAKKLPNNHSNTIFYDHRTNIAWFIIIVYKFSQTIPLWWL